MTEEMPTSLWRLGPMPSQPGVRQMNCQLKELMGYTGVETLDAFDATVLWYHGRHLGAE